MRKNWLRVVYYLFFNFASLYLIASGLRKFFGLSKNLVVVLGALFALIMIGLTTIEFLIRISEKRRKHLAENLKSPHRELLERRLEAIRNPPFEIQEFLAELDSYYVSGLTTKTGDHRSAADFKGKYINVVGGIRKGLISNKNCERTVFMLGGSTVACLEGPDEWTLPSRLQKQFNDFEVPIEVVNLGVSGSTTVDRFKAANSCKLVKPNDVLLFWFGVNEGKGLWGRRGRGALAFWPGYVEILGLLSRRSRILVIRLLYLATVVFDEKAQRRLARSRAKSLKRQFENEADRWSNHSVKLIAGLQPTIFSSETDTEFRSELSKNWKPEMEAIMRIQYEEFCAAFQNSEYFIDFSRSTNLSVYDSFVDWAHTSWLGNEIIAEKIALSRTFRTLAL